MASRLIFILLLLSVGCSHNDVSMKDPVGTYSVKKAELELLHDSWVKDFGDEWRGRDCDGMIWNGKAASFNSRIDLTVAEPDGEGRFYRRPDPHCWYKEKVGTRQGSASTWSRDMAICGLYPWLWKQKKLDAAIRHAEYGKENLWKMGEPLADGRVIYTPNMIGALYEIIYALGGPDSSGRLWPATYKKGLDDYQAHLQICSIWLRGEIARHHIENGTGEKKYEFGEITQTMFERVKEHYKREPNDHFYAYMYGAYTGDMHPALDVCLDLKEKGGSYVRCHKNDDSCYLSAKIFACGLVLERLKDE